MSVKHVKGDLFSTDARIIAHGTNCQGVMGSGVAAIVRDKYPGAYDMYKLRYSNEGLMLGRVQFVCTSEDDEPETYIANCMTQDEYGTHKRQANYEAIYTCFEHLRDFALHKDIKEVALPCIGAGLAGGDWNIIKAMLESVFFDGCGVCAIYYTID